MGRASTPAEARPQPSYGRPRRERRCYAERQNAFKSPRTLPAPMEICALARIRFADVRRTPVWLVSAANWEGVKSSIGAAAARVRRALRFRAEGRAAAVPARRGRGARRRPVRGRRARRAGARSVRRRQARDRRCPRASTASPTRSPTPIWRRSAFCSRSIAIDRFRAEPAPKPRSSRPTASTRSGSSASPPRSPSDATSSMRRPMRSDRTRSSRRR